MKNERDIRRRLSKGSPIEPPAGLLEAIQQEIPEETFGPPLTALPETAGSPRPLRFVAAAVVILAAGLLAVGVARNGGLPGGVEPVSEVALAEAELASTGPEDERLRSLGYIDAED
ncbi:MAG: hypothetical protein AAGK22_15095, partial [Acidobacteriota bacterium]